MNLRHEAVSGGRRRSRPGESSSWVTHNTLTHITWSEWGMLQVHQKEIEEAFQEIYTSS